MPRAQGREVALQVFGPKRQLDPPANRMALSGHRLPADWHSRSDGRHPNQAGAQGVARYYELAGAAVTGTTNTEVHMNTTRIMTIAALIAAT